ncbi:MAG: LysR family transcriptional regulator [Salinarimonas sp.]|nr:LysR family transcriptional regulator [Salinarimonas sp.]
MDRSSDMAVFVAVIENGGFSPAARALGMTHSAVSKRVSQLEQRLGAQLLVRTTRSMRLTEAGQAYIGEARRILDAITALEQGLGDGAQEPRGVLRISASNAFGQRHIVPAAIDFMRVYEEVQVDLTLTDQMIDLVASGTHVAIRSAALTDSSLVARKLALNERVVVASPAYLEAHGAPRDPGDLEARDCLLLNHETRFNDWGYRSSGGRRLKLQGAFACNTVESLHAAALAGAGIARLPAFLIGDDVEAGRLKPILEEYRPPAESAIYAVRPGGGITIPAARVFIDFLVARFQPVPPWQLTRGG